ncbi:MAG: type II toxin-antitoxin system VapC family toxin [Actinopolymorphaceae bacterium]
MIYLDSSAIVKLARQDAESDALRTWIAGNPRPLVASALVRTEATLALTRTEPSALPTLRAVLALLHQAPVTDPILDVAGGLPGTYLRSLDAIHVATAEGFSGLLTSFVAYDKRLVEAASSRGLPVISPA